MSLTVLLIAWLVLHSISEIQLSKIGEHNDMWMALINVHIRQVWYDESMAKCAAFLVFIYQAVAMKYTAVCHH